MKTPLRVAVFGFSDFERRALGSFFRLAGRHGGSHEPVEHIGDAQFIIADAAAALAPLHQADRLADTVFVGTHAPVGAAACLPRPIDALALMREIDALAARRTQAPVVTVRSAAVPDGGALLVDDSAVALRHLQLRLQGLGVASVLAENSARALELLAHQSFAYIFIDVELGAASALDGLALCQHIKRAHRHVGGRAPQIVIVSAHDSELDRVRGTFAGCDHYLGKPVDDAALRRTLARARLRSAQSH